jgi:SAM-dependent methyltransferase
VSDRFEVEEPFRFVGRTFTEYRRMFGLDPTSLAGRRVLDCPGGPGSFTAVAATLGADPVAVDPAYGPPTDVLADRCRDAVARTVRQLRTAPENFVWAEYEDPDHRGRYLRAAAERFLADYRAHPGRYPRAGLPDLPFRDDTFDLAVSGNLLFLYDDRLDRAFHRAALLELARVAREVRVFPLASLDGERSSLLEPLLGTLRERGLDATLRTTRYEFQPGATTVLVLGGRGSDS